MRSKFFIVICSLAAPRPTFGHQKGDILTQPFSFFNSKGNQEPHNEAGSLIPASSQVGFIQGNFPFICNALTNWTTLPTRPLSSLNQGFQLHCYLYPFLIFYLQKLSAEHYIEQAWVPYFLWFSWFT